MRKFFLALIAVLTVGALHAQDITGNWQGTLDVGKGLRIVLKISKADGQLKALTYSIDQDGRAMPATSIALQATTVTMAVKPIGLTYTGTLSADGKTITGNATQGGETHALNLASVTADAMWPIPEPPKAMPADAKPVFDVLTVKPSDPHRPGIGFSVNGRHVSTYNTTLSHLITFAYGVHHSEIINAPAWVETEKFDLDGVPDIEGQPSATQMKQLIQDALTSRFKLTFHKDKKELPVYILTVKGGPKMAVTQDGPSAARNFNFRKLGELNVSNSTMDDFCKGMQGAVMDRPVLDHTGLTDRYDFKLSWTPDESQFIALGVKITPPTTDEPNAPPSLSTAMQEQLGLKWKPPKPPPPSWSSTTSKDPPQTNRCIYTYF